MAEVIVIQNGDSLTLTFDITNKSLTTNAPNVTSTFTVGAGLTLDSVTSSGAGSFVDPVFTTGTLALNTTDTLTATVTVVDISGDVTLQCVVATTATESLLADNTIIKDLLEEYGAVGCHEVQGCSPIEEALCLNNEATPASVFADPNAPATSEVLAWAIANLTDNQLANGTYIGYYTTGACADPNYVWVLNEGTRDITRIKSPGDLDVSATPAATVATGDKVLFLDIDDSDNLKQDTAQAIADLKVSELSEDTTPVLSGDLDLGTNDIIGTGNINITGTIDSTGNVNGRDMSADGTKLDGVEALADVTDETNVLAALDGATIPTATVTATDKVLIQDADDLDNVKTVTAQSIADLASAATDHGLLTGLADDDHTQYLLADGTRAMSGALDMGTNNVTNVGTVDGRDVSADGTKLDGIESGATADQTGAEIKVAYEAELDTNAFTDAEKTKLAGIETGATTDMTGAEIKAAYEAEANTNAFTDAEKTKLAGIEALADVTDSTNVDAAGAVMNSDTTTAAMSFVIDEDNMASNLATKVPTQQSVKAYVDANGGLANIVEDTTPQLGGELDVNDQVIASGTGSNIVFKLGDTSGANSMSITDSGEIEQFNLNSDGTFKFLGAFVAPPTTVGAGNYTALATDFIIRKDCSSSTNTIALPSVASLPTGLIYCIYDSTQQAGTNPITVDPNGLELINGGTSSKTIAVNGGYIWIQTNGSQWNILSEKLT